MSIIHEALRKVQDQRRGQRETDTHQAVRVVAGWRSPRRGGAIVALGILGVVLVGLGWKGFLGKQETPVPAATPVAVGQLPAPSTPTPSKGEKLQDALQRGWRAFQRGDLVTAEQSFRAAMSLDHGSALAHNNLGVVLRAQGRIPEAIGAYREAVRLQPDYADALGNLGSALAQRGRDQEAMDFLAQAVRNAPKQPGWHLSLAVVLDRQKKGQKAVVHYRRYLTLAGSGADPKVQQVRARLTALEAGE